MALGNGRKWPSVVRFLCGFLLRARYIRCPAISGVFHRRDQPIFHLAFHLVGSSGLAWVLDSRGRHHGRRFIGLSHETVQ